MRFKKYKGRRKYGDKMYCFECTATDKFCPYSRRELGEWHEACSDFMPSESARKVIWRDKYYEAITFKAANQQRTANRKN